MINRNLAEIGRRIKQLRKEKKLSQGDFAEKIGRDFTTISKIEAGKLELSSTIRLAICNVFGVRKDWLETGQGPQYDDRWSVLEERARDLGDDIHTELMMLKAYREVYKEGRPTKHEDEKLAGMIEKLEDIYKHGDFNLKARLRGTLEELYDELKAKESASEENPSKGQKRGA